VNRDAKVGRLADATSPVDSSASRQSLPSALRNILSNWAGFACSSIISFFLSPFVVHHLGNSGYGVWVFIGSLTGYLGLLNFGVRGAVTRYVARFQTEGNHHEASAVTSSALLIFLAAGLLAVLLAVVLAAFALPMFHISPIYQFAARVVIVIGGLNIAVSLIFGVFGGVLAALHRFDLSNLIEVVNSLLSAFVTVLVLSVGKGIIALAIVNLASAVAVGIAYTIAAFQLYPALKIRLSLCDRAHFRLIFSFSLYGFLTQTSFNLIFYTDAIVIASFLSAAMVTPFAIAGNLMNYSRALIRGISTTMSPRASALEVMGRPGELQAFLLKAVRFGTLVIMPISLTFLLRGSSFIRLWMGQQYGEQSGRVLWILAWALMFMASDQVAVSTMLGIGKQKLMAFVVLAEAVCNLLLSIALVHTLGIYGVAWGTAVPSLAVSLFFWPWYVHRILGIPIRTYIASAWLRPGASALPFGLLSYWIERQWPAVNLPIYFLQVALTLPTVILAAWFLCFDPSDRKIYARRVALPVLRTFGWS
jgi:O-antigen/teichoic acid export membrane protein